MSICAPPRLVAQGAIPLDNLWKHLDLERRVRVLRILASVVARQLVPPPRKEADSDRQNT